MNKLRVGLGVLGICVFLSGVSFAELAKTDDSFSMPKNTAPEISQWMGKADIELLRTKWPEITACNGSTGCCSELQNNISNAYLPGESKDNFKEYSDLSMDVALKPEFRNTSKLLVSWTVRVVTSSLNQTLPYTWNAATPPGGKCADVSTFGLTAKQSILKGEVKTKLYVVYNGNAEAKGSEVSLVFPGSDGSTRTQTIDPPTPPTPPTPSGCCKAGDPGCCNPRNARSGGAVIRNNCQCPCGFEKRKNPMGQDSCLCEDPAKAVDEGGICVDPEDCKYGSHVFAQTGTCDPTITGSYVLRKEDFGGQFPATMKLQVRIHNDTAWNLVSLANQHNIVLTQFPVTKESK